MEKTKLNPARKKVEPEGSQGAAAKDRLAETLLVGHDLMVMHRLIEIG